MTYLLKHNEKSSRSSWVKGLLITLALVAIGVFVIGSGSVKSVFNPLAIPLLSAGDGFYKFVNIVPNWFRGKAALIQEIATLNEKLVSMSFNEADFTALNYENKRLREELLIQPKESFLRASVIARSPQVPLDSVLINKGSGDGVVAGDLVLVSEHSLAGKVAEVNGGTSVVALSSSSNNSFVGIVARTGEAVEVKGVGGGNLSTRTPIDFDIQTGDSLLISQGSNYMVAVVGLVESDVSGGAKNSLMSLPFNIGTLETVFVLK